MMQTIVLWLKTKVQSSSHTSEPRPEALSIFRYAFYVLYCFYCLPHIVNGTILCIHIHIIEPCILHMLSGLLVGNNY